MPGVLIGLVDHIEPLRRKGLGQSLDDGVAGSHAGISRCLLAKIA
jgi:hypothetical protein